MNSDVRKDVIRRCRRVVVKAGTRLLTDPQALPSLVAQIAAIRKFAEENCSGGYHQLETASIVDGEEPPVPEDDENASSVTADLCGRYYGAKQLRLYDEKGQRVDPDGRPVYGEDEETDAADDAQQEAHTETMDVPEIDIEEAFEDIIAEETEEAEDGK